MARAHEPRVPPLRARRGYLASIILLQAYRFPWAEMARGLVEWIAP